MGTSFGRSMPGDSSLRACWLFRLRNFLTHIGTVRLRQIFRAKRSQSHTFCRRQKGTQSCTFLSATKKGTQSCTFCRRQKGTAGRTFCYRKRERRAAPFATAKGKAVPFLQFLIGESKPSIPPGHRPRDLLGQTTGHRGRRPLPRPQSPQDSDPIASPTPRPPRD